jgi:hypothetical protein
MGAFLCRSVKSFSCAAASSSLSFRLSLGTRMGTLLPVGVNHTYSIFFPFASTSSGFFDGATHEVSVTARTAPTARMRTNFIAGHTTPNCD